MDKFLKKSSEGKPKAREQTFCAKYSQEFPFIAKSQVSANHAFCKPCRRDIVISHGGRSDIVQHCKSKVHIRALEAELQVGRSQTSIAAFTEKKEEGSSAAIKAECLFASFYVEHNIPLAAADHMGKLLRAAFPNSEEVKQFHGGRTKSSCIVKEMAKDTRALVESLKNLPFSVATDGSHTSDAKLYPLVVTYPDSETKSIKSQLLSMPTLNGPSSGVNIGELVLTELDNLDVEIKNCISLSSDNAPVMLGQKSGVIAKLKQSQPDLIAIGCPCHLINLAAQHAAKELPVSVDSILIDVYYYLESSVNRKQALEQFQELLGLETQKILRHVCTRWLSLGLCLPRFNTQWDALLAFFKSESADAKPASKEMPPLLMGFTIPKKGLPQQNPTSSPTSSKSTMQKVSSSVPHKVTKKTKSSPFSGPSKPAEAPLSSTKRKPSESTPVSAPKRKKTEASFSAEDPVKFSRPQKLVKALTCKTTKAVSCFLQFSITNFERTNAMLQTSKPLIHSLKSILESFLKQQMATFLKPSAFTGNEDVKYINYKDTSLHKSDQDVSIGSGAHSIVSTMDEDEKQHFYRCVKNYFIKSCDYVVSKFPMNSEVLLHAQVADVKRRDTMGFSSVRFFLDKFPVLVQRNDGEPLDVAVDSLEMEFNEYAVSSFSEDQKNLPADQFWFFMLSLVNGDGTPKFKKLSHFMLGILSIPHSNAECERIFSQVRKNKTDFRGSLSNDMLSSLLIQKSRPNNVCYKQEFSAAFLKKAKAATSGQ